MNIKDRLQKNIIVNDNIVELKKSQLDDTIISDIFNDTTQAKNLLIDLINNKKNIVIISKKSFDKIIIANYISQLLQDKNTFIIDDIDNNFDNLNDRINIILNPNIHIIVKIFEQIIYGCQSFIFGLNLGSYDNIIDKLKVLIAINYKNLSSNDINTLLSASNLDIVYISKNDIGQLYISKIDELKFNNIKYELEIFNIYDTNENFIEETSNEIVENIPNDIQQIIEEKQEHEITQENNETFDITNEEIAEEEIISNQNTIIETSSIVEQPEQTEQPQTIEPPLAPEEIETTEISVQSDEIKQSLSTGIDEPSEPTEQQEHIEEIIQNETEEFQPVVNSNETINTESAITENRVLNKYQLLREKAKRKKQEENI